MESKQSRRLLAGLEENVLTQLMRELTGERASLDLVFMNRRTDGRCNGWRLSWAQLSPNDGFDSWRRRGFSRTAALDFQQADFGLFRSLVDRVLWEAVLKD